MMSRDVTNTSYIRQYIIVCNISSSVPSLHSNKVLSTNQSSKMKITVVLVVFAAVVVIATATVTPQGMYCCLTGITLRILFRKYKQYLMKQLLVHMVNK